MTNPLTLKQRSMCAPRITDYLAGGGLVNPELADHNAVRDLLIECRDETNWRGNALVECIRFLKRLGYSEKDWVLQQAQAAIDNKEAPPWRAVETPPRTGLEEGVGPYRGKFWHECQHTSGWVRSPDFECPICKHKLGEVETDGTKT